MKTYNSESFKIYKYLETCLIVIHIIGIISFILFIGGIAENITEYMGIEFLLLPLYLGVGILPEIFGSFIYYIILFSIPIAGLYIFKNQRKKIHFSLIVVGIISVFCHYLIVQGLSYVS